MSMTRGRPGSGSVRKTKEVGPDYPDERFRNPFNGPGIDSQYGSDTSKTLDSPTATAEGPGIPLNHEYDKYWEGR